MADASEKHCKLNAYKNTEALLNNENKPISSLAKPLKLERQNITNWKTRGIPCYLWPKVANLLKITMEQLIADEIPDRYENSNIEKPPPCKECEICRNRKFNKDKHLSFQDITCIGIRVYVMVTGKKCKYYIDKKCTYPFD